jgi:hypothetical protein
MGKGVKPERENRYSHDLPLHTTRAGLSNDFHTNPARLKEKNV